MPRILPDEGCDCNLEAEICDLPVFLRRGPLRLVYVRKDRRGRRTFIEAKADDFMTGRNA